MKIDKASLPGRQANSEAVSPRVVIVGLGVLGGLTGLTFLLILLTLHRGFDWSDEGFVITLLTNNRVSDGEVWGFQHLLHPFFVALGENIVAFRILRLLGYIGLSVFLCWIAMLTLKRLGISLRRQIWILVFLVAQVGTFAAWSYPPRYLGYNELAAWISQATGALLIFLVISSRTPSTLRPRLPRIVMWVLIGALIALAFIAKFTASLLLLGLAVLIVFFIPGAVQRLLSLTALLGGVLASLIVMLILQVPVVQYSQSVLTLLVDPSAQSASGYSLSSLIAVYLQSASVTISAIAVPAMIIAAGLIMSRGWAKNPFSSHPPVLASLEHLSFAFVIVLGLIMMLPKGESTWDGIGISNALLFAVVVIGFAILVKLPAPEPGPNPAVTAAIALTVFALTPLISGLGTTNAIFGQTVFSATIWAVGAAVMLAIFLESARAASVPTRIIPVILMMLFVLSSSLAVVGDVFKHPYRTSPYFKQSSMTDSGALKGLALLPQETALATWLHEAGIRHNADSQPAISLATPGALLAFNASPWVNAWPGPDWAKSIERACTKDFPTGMFLLQSGDALPGTSAYDMAVTGLKACDISFPEDFIKVDERPDDDPSHRFTIWRLANESRPLS